MKGDGAAIPSSGFLRRPEQPLITLCSHASPPPSPPPRPRPSRPSQSQPGPPGLLANGGGRDAGTCERRGMFPVTHPRASLRLGRPHPSVPASEDLPRRPPPPLVCLPLPRLRPRFPFLPLSRPTPFPPLPTSPCPSQLTLFFPAGLPFLFFPLHWRLEDFTQHALSVAAYIKGPRLCNCIVSDVSRAMVS